MTGPWCGTVNGYSNRGCRCDDCRAANAAASRRWAKANPDKVKAHKARWRAIEAGEIPKGEHPSKRVAKCGTLSGWQRHHRLGEDPCEDCKAVRRVFQRESQRRRRSR